MDVEADWPHNHCFRWFIINMWGKETWLSALSDTQPPGNHSWLRYFPSYQYFPPWEQIMTHLKNTAHYNYWIQPIQVQKTIPKFIHNKSKYAIWFGIHGYKNESSALPLHYFVIHNLHFTSFISLSFREKKKKSIQMW